MAESRSRWRWAEIGGGALAGILAGLAVFAWWVVYGGEAPPVDEVTRPVDAGRLTVVEPLKDDARRRGVRGPVLGAFAARVERRLGDADLPTMPISGPVVVEMRRLVWVESDGRTFATASSATGLLDLGVDGERDVVISNAVLTEPRVSLRESGGTWNYETVLADVIEEQPNGDTRPPPDRTVRVRGLTIEGGELDVEAETSFALADLDARIDEIVFSGPNVPAPALDIAMASATLIRADTIAPVDVMAADAQVRLLDEHVAFDVALATYDGIAVDVLSGTYDSDRPGLGVEATGTVNGLELAELDPFLPDTVELDGTASFEFAIAPTPAGGTRVELSDLDAVSEGSRIAGAATVRVEPDRVVLEQSDLVLDPLEIARLEPFTGPLPYSGTVRGTVSGPASALQFDLAADLTTEAGETFPAQLVGMVDLDEGGGLRNLTAELETVPLVALEPLLPGLDLRGTVSGTILLAGAPDATPIGVDVRLNLAAGIVTLDGVVDLTGPSPAYDLTGRLVGVQPSLIFERPLPPVLMTADFSLVGQGTASETAVAQVALAGRFTGWESNPGDTVQVRAAIDRGVVTVDTLDLTLSTLELAAGGEWRAIEPITGEIRYAAAIESIEPWAEYVPALADTAAGAPVVDGAIVAEGTVTGRLAAPRLAGTIEAEQLAARGWTFEAIDATYEAALGGNVPMIIVDAEATGIRSSAAGAFSTAQLDFRLDAPTFTFELVADQEGDGVVEISADGTVPPVGPRRLVLRNAVADLEGERWTLVQPATFDWGDDQGLIVNDFEMRNEATEGRVAIDGRVLPLDEIDANVDVVALPVGEIQELAGMPARVTGLLTTTARIRGPGEAPTVTAEFELVNGTIEDVPVETLVGSLDYANAALVIEATAALDTAGSFIIDARLPVVMQLGTDASGIRFADAGRMEGSITADSVSIAPLGGLSLYVTNLAGRVDGTVTMEGTVADPQFGGELRLTDGSVTFTPLQQDYTDVTANVVFEGRRAVVEPLVLHSDGTATITGTITFEELTQPVADLVAQLVEFRAVGVPNHEDAAVWGEVAVTGPYDALDVTGDIRVDDGYIPIPEYDSGLDYLADIPGAALPDGADAPSPILEGLTIEDLEVEVGSNVWFTSEPARVQLAGDMTLNMIAGVFTLSGTLTGQRGVYTLEAGPIVRRFEIVSAEVRFLGLPDLDPAIDVTASKTVYDPSGRPVEIEVRVTGTIRAPVLSLASADAPSIPESELLSFLFFGRPSAELDGAGLPGETLLEYTFLGGLAELATLELEEALIEDIGLSFDVFQVRLGPGSLGGFGSPTFVFGWELGPHLFLTTEYAVGALTDDSDLAGRAWAIRLEWAFDPNAQLRASWETVSPGPYSRSLGFGLPSVRPRQQFSLDLRKRWNY